MKFSINGNWNESFNQDGLLYCVQRIEEMLMPYTSHLYKVPVYNTLLLVYEYLETYNKFEEGHIDKNHLTRIIEECIASFETDIVISEYISPKTISYLASRLKGSSLSEQNRIMQYLFQIISNYPEWCVESLRNAVNNPQGKKDIEKALRSFIPMIIGIGYHPRYIYKECKTRFRVSIESMESFDAFLGLFSGRDREFDVFYPVDKKALIFKDILHNRLNILFDDDKRADLLRIDKTKQVRVHVKESALDPYTAARKAYENYNLFERYYSFLGHRNKLIGNRCLIWEGKGTCYRSYIGLERYFYSKNYDELTLGRNSEHVITQLLKNVYGNDFLKIDKAILTHKSALMSKNITDAFLNMWSVLEILVIDDYRQDTSKIVQIINGVVPILLRNYVNRIVEELHNYLKANLDEEQYSELMESVSEDGTDYYKIACMISLLECEDSRQKAYSMLKSYPIIRSRISQLYNDVFKKKKQFKSEIIRYEKRLNWHIQRLYRVRNSIIHSGEGYDNMVSLVEHLHSYVDELIFDLIDRMTRADSMVTITNVMIDAQLFVDTVFKDCSSDDVFDADDIKMILG